MATLLGSQEDLSCKRNEPLYVVEVAKKIAELKEISVEEIARQTMENTKRVFKL